MISLGQTLTQKCLLGILEQHDTLNESYFHEDTSLAVLVSKNQERKHPLYHTLFPEHEEILPYNIKVSAKLKLSYMF